jgi:hypothetical protein
MREFLDDFLEENRELDDKIGKDRLTQEFERAISVARSLGEKPFRIGPSLNAAIFDGVMVGIASRLEKGPIRERRGLEKAYAKLLKNPEFQAAYVRATSDDESVRNRIKIATDTLADVP